VELFILLSLIAIFELKNVLQTNYSSYSIFLFPIVLHSLGQFYFPINFYSKTINCEKKFLFINISDFLEFKYSRALESGQW